jgi:hypothetical protein
LPTPEILPLVIRFHKNIIKRRLFSFSTLKVNKKQNSASV